MLDSKRQRGRVIVAVVVAWLALGAVWTVASDRTAERSFAAFSERADAVFEGTDAAAMDELQATSTVDSWNGEASELTTLLTRAGDVRDYRFDTHVAHYQLPDAWGRGVTATVTWTADGFTVTRD